MKIHLLSSFLGSGKTAAMQLAVQVLLQQEVKTGVISNDQGMKLVDDDLFKSLNIPGRQVVRIPDGDNIKCYRICFGAELTQNDLQLIRR